MRNTCFLLAVLLLLPGCKSPQARILLPREHAQSLGLRLSGGLAVETSGALLLTTPTTLVRYHTSANRLEELLNDPARDLRDVALTSEGVILVLRARELSAFLAGYLVRICRLPGEGVALACGREAAYVLVATPSGGRLLRIALSGPDRGLLQPMLASEDRPRALCAVPGGCLVASGGNLLKVTDPAPGHGRQEVSTALLISMQEPILSIAADPERRTVYLATADATHAWTPEGLLPFFPAGDRLTLIQDRLFIGRSSGDAQIVEIPSASRLLQTLRQGKIRK
jgi:hypothetical protein